MVSPRVRIATGCGIGFYGGHSTRLAIVLDRMGQSGRQSPYIAYPLYLTIPFCDSGHFTSNRIYITVYGTEVPPDVHRHTWNMVGTVNWVAASLQVFRRSSRYQHTHVRFNVDVVLYAVAKP